jgi:hypothetical protein
MRPSRIAHRILRQRGQAATEMVVAAAFLLPLFLSVVYAARYVDIKQSTVQASRYVAWERVIDPASTRTDADLAKEVRTRFFASGNRLGGAINSTNFVGGTPASDEYNTFWSDQGGNRLLNSFTDVTVNTRAQSTPGTITSGLSHAEVAALKLNDRGFVTANVETSLQNVKGFDPLAAINLRIGASTSVLGDTWGANGPEQVKTRVKRITPDAVVGELVSPFASFLAPFEYTFTDFHFGCIAPDVVPADRLKPYHPSGYCE